MSGDTLETFFGRVWVTFSRFLECLGMCVGVVWGPFWTDLGRFRENRDVPESYRIGFLRISGNRIGRNRIGLRWPDNRIVSYRIGCFW